MRMLTATLVAAGFVMASGLASAQVQIADERPQTSADRPAAKNDPKGELGRTDPKPGSAQEAAEPKAGTKVLGQPEPRTEAGPSTSK